MKRFTESCKWDDPWFRGLTGVQKLCFLYVIDRCNNAGFWEIDEDSMAFHTKLKPELISGAWQGLVRGLIRHGGWVWVRRFLRHQKNEALNPLNNAHSQIIALLKEQVERFSECLEFSQFLAPYQPLIRGSGMVEVKVRKKRDARGKEPIVIPDSLKTEAFEEAWDRYTDYRKQAHMKPLLAMSINDQFREFEKWGEETTILAIKTTIQKGWQGVFHPDQSGASNGSHPPQGDGMFLTK